MASTLSRWSQFLVVRLPFRCPCISILVESAGESPVPYNDISNQPAYGFAVTTDVERARFGQTVAKSARSKASRTTPFAEPAGTPVAGGNNRRHDAIDACTAACSYDTESATSSFLRSSLGALPIYEKCREVVLH